ncbi:hypothetical protein [Paludisphaera borealis]|uniref:Uncharacterized protein n=1 Tax=Paludisphaera borealis TaxID=1387353 RepID=A0A1U7CNQ2_9BACT|nr:hypothetical protein [Paludisphaera borealis]APW60539.1 hypothetical protein BSF38_02011 [Paludisphaera borealis]
MASIRQGGGELLGESNGLVEPPNRQKPGVAGQGVAEISISTGRDGKKSNDNDPVERQGKLAELRSLLATLPKDETAVFQDGVDVNTNPKIGSMWMRRGQQAEVEPPGNNEKRYLAGSIHWRSGRVFLIEGRPKQKRDETLFLAHLDDRELHHPLEELRPPA